ncbi:hypothetical protein P872_06865 [Rhodonellum psychrophilum GCM71 = DSM 17998]|uniref:histidine kinase n=2 Tax=Rhodonellum TaxID=336827 RepID=U5C1C6_9BACT|nr:MULTISPECIES: ATP-binding protein [Rhodonellum]ERM81962.1 hypothetical protein P872_06865 [Rhodonellum psychrophilum GCM71 = DSM 17998]MDO9553706.1 ATP-binding protein [Rhodonellum sp.]SDY69842.1 His Kinase A (phospho-acceptor) domain-containing protein [Rhodonellum ikkaensis]
MEMTGEEKSIQLNKIIDAQSSQIQEMLKERAVLRKQLLRAEKLSTLGLLSAGIVHEIKNPLGFINNFSELSIEYLQEVKEQLTSIQEQSETNEIRDLIEDVETNLNKIQHHGGRINRIVTSMLLHSREGSGQFEPYDLNLLITEFVNLAFHGMRAGKDPINVDIQLDLDRSIPLVPLKAEDFSRVILNLCNNAFDALREKNDKRLNREYSEGPHHEGPKLTVKSVWKEEWVVLEIEDNGPGIPKSHREKIFEPFFTTKNRLQGTGLGLGITQDIIKNHKGSLALESEEKLFTRFIIKIPTHLNSQNENIER